MARYGHDILDARETTHGDYAQVSQTAQAIKRAMLETPNWREMPHYARESLDLIATKIARICNGDFNTQDHWRDIAGYAELTARQFVLHAQGVAAVAAALHPQDDGEGSSS